MRAETMAPQEALARGRELPYALVRSLSAVTLGPTPQEIRADELLEARFFSREEEIRVFRQDGELRAAALRDADGERAVDRTYRVANPALGTEITVRTYLDFDEDGQAYARAARLMDWKGEADHG